MNTLIIHGSRYGTTKRYAEKFAEITHFPIISYEDVKNLADYERIIYFGALYAGGIKGLKNTVKKLSSNVHIGLTQLGTRCGDGSCEAAEDLIAGFPPIKAEAKLVQVRLELPAATVISAEQERFQVADGFVQPMQIAGFVLFRVQLHAGQIPIASVAVAFDF